MSTIKANDSDFENLYNSPISIKDATEMLKRKPQPNDRPFVAGTTNLNNGLVDRWEKEVLNHISDEKDCIPSGRVWDSWQIFEEGIVVTKFIEQKQKGIIQEIKFEDIEYWKNLFENGSITEIFDHGSGSIGFGWRLLNDYIKMWYAEQKYTQFYSKFSTPLEWEKNYHNYTKLLKGDVHPLWSSKETRDIINQKVLSILINNIKPQNSESLGGVQGSM